MHRHYLLFGHGGSYNHGCEALTSCTAKLLRDISPHCHISVSTHFAEQDREFRLPVEALFQRNANASEPHEAYADAIASICPETVCIDVAGDNYCYPNWQRYAAIHEVALERGAKSILWSCSVDADKITDEMLDCFRSRNLITVRDGGSYHVLQSAGLTNIARVSDIAFTLQAKACDCPQGEFVVLNASPLIARKNSNVLTAYKALIEYILKNTDLNIALVPHVLAPVDNDYDILRELHRASPRIVLIGDKLSAAEYKFIVSKARVCVTARTHLAIAAYSCCVPVLAVGYNSKARGIASDLHQERFVLDIESLTSDKLTRKFQSLLASENFVRDKLKQIIPTYAKSAISDDVLAILR